MSSSSLPSCHYIKALSFFRLPNGRHSLILSDEKKPQDIA
ncbi:hypothetical protein BCBMB205_39470 [Bacillus sp. CN2]|nr:hypothetical protein BCBMB205_39470 [Bacillus velezensis]ARZ60292.1 hypothetical protein BAGQ_4092 [Bacillus velezensis]GFR55372.1 hypothetical protein BCBMB205_39470 [Bacillus sp. CN2]